MAWLYKVNNKLNMLFTYNVSDHYIVKGLYYKVKFNLIY